MRGRPRSVDRGTCRPGIQPRKKRAPERRRCKEKRKAISGASPERDATELRAVRDPGHVRKHLAREPGELVVAQDGWRLGSPRTHAGDARPRAVGQARSTDEVPEQGWATGRGGSGGK